MSTQTITAATIQTNGVDVTALFGTIDAIKSDPGLAEFRFRADNHWVDGGHNRSSIGGFYGCVGRFQHFGVLRRIGGTCSPLAGQVGFVPNLVSFYSTFIAIGHGKSIIIKILQIIGRANIRQGCTGGPTWLRTQAN